MRHLDPQGCLPPPARRPGLEPSPRPSRYDARQLDLTGKQMPLRSQIRSSTAPIIIRVSGVRVPPPALAKRPVIPTHLTLRPLAQTPQNRPRGHPPRSYGICTSARLCFPRPLCRQRTTTASPVSVKSSACEPRLRRFYAARLRKFPARRGPPDGCPTRPLALTTGPHVD